jgi:hypothetical protein
MSRKNIERDEIGVSVTGPMCIAQSIQMAYISDLSQNRICALNLNSMTMRYYALEDDMRGPGVLMFDNHQNRLFVADNYNNGNICVYRVAECEELEKIGTISEQEIRGISGFEIDADNNLLYVSDKNNDCIAITSLARYTFVGRKAVDSPSLMKLKGPLLFVTSNIYWDLVKHERPVEHDLNCIYVYNRFYWTVERQIRCDDWSCPRGLHVDDQGNVLTIARCTPNADSKNVDRKTYLFVMNAEGVMEQKLDLRCDHISDFCVTNNRFVFLRFDYFKYRLTIMDIA